MDVYVQGLGKYLDCNVLGNCNVMLYVKLLHKLFKLCFFVMVKH
ncbi:hypothetical protein [Paenibacillus ihuae]|nr:hypothetical protein [Paenibacillus ihuae]